MPDQTLLALVLRVKQLACLLSISKSSIWAKLNPRSRYYDPSFPKPFKIGRATCFSSAEATAFIDAKIRASRCGEDSSELPAVTFNRWK